MLYWESYVSEADGMFYADIRDGEEHMETVGPGEDYEDVEEMADFIIAMELAHGYIVRSYGRGPAPSEREELWSLVQDPD